MDSPIPKRRMRGHPEPSGSGLTHSSRDLLGKVLRVEFIDALDNSLHELAGWCVVRVLCDGDHADAPAPEHRLESDCVLTLASKQRELPDQDLLERRILRGRVIKHLPKLRPVSNASALGLVYILSRDDVSVLLGIVPKRPQLRRDRKVYVLPLAGHAGIQRNSRIQLWFVLGR